MWPSVRELSRVARCECPKVRVRRDGARLARALEGWARRIRQLEMAADVRHAGDRADDEQRKPDAARRAQGRGDMLILHVKRTGNVHHLSVAGKIPQRSTFQIVLVTTLNAKPQCHRYTTYVQGGCEVALAIIITMYL